MNWIEKVIAVLAVVVVLDARAGDDGSTNNPYAIISTRNVFGLQPPPLPVATAVDAVPPLQITLKGTTSVLGSQTVLFTVIGQPSLTQPFSAKSYILNEGEQQDGIEVQQVNERGGFVTFNNHGTIQEIAMGKQSVAPPPVEFHHPFF